MRDALIWRQFILHRNRISLIIDSCYAVNNLVYKSLQSMGKLGSCSSHGRFRLSSPGPDSDTEFLSVSDDPQIHLLIDFNESKLARMTPELENKILDDSIVSLGVEVVVYQSNLRQFHCTG
ncbi:uncharacterized protein LOC129748755 [Uranotaenia lowii]|uniref:uncharacterized protein LOC129748755 n=1 Tax=Uranotaenia lowii TaxID=190385 RepID=UPI00247AE968|nr:uncharacterized protein LOC129748755 [Uranotaenia lowii]